MVMKHFIDCKICAPQIKFPRSNRSAIYRVFVTKSPLFTLPSGNEGWGQEQADIVAGQSKVQAGAYYESRFFRGTGSETGSIAGLMDSSVLGFVCYLASHACLSISTTNLHSDYSIRMRAQCKFIFSCFAQKFAFLKKPKENLKVRDMSQALECAAMGGSYSNYNNSNNSSGINWYWKYFVDTLRQLAAAQKRHSNWQLVASQTRMSSPVWCRLLWFAVRCARNTPYKIHHKYPFDPLTLF